VVIRVNLPVRRRLPVYPDGQTNLSVARAFTHDPKLILMDEPFGAPGASA
jgi:ABC-type proline/glycine betaine transport system ATPase subunit